MLQTTASLLKELHRTVSRPVETYFTVPMIPRLPAALVTLACVCLCFLEFDVRKEIVGINGTVRVSTNNSQVRFMQSGLGFLEFGVMCAWKCGWSQCEPLRCSTMVHFDAEFTWLTIHQFTVHALSSVLFWQERHASLIDWLGIYPPHTG